MTSTDVTALQSADDTQPTATLGGPNTITAAAGRTRHLRRPGDRIPAGIQIPAEWQWGDFHADRAFGEAPTGGAQ